MDTPVSGIVKFSEAASLALHTMTLLAAGERHTSVREIADVLPVSETHLAKVMQRLAKAGLVESVRGPRGGFALRGNPARITLLHVYEAIEGPLAIGECLFGEPQCDGPCILGDALCGANALIHERLSRTRLSELANVFDANARPRGKDRAAARRQTASGRFPARAPSARRSRGKL